METFWTKFNFLPAGAMLLTGFGISANAQVVCTMSTGTVPVARAEGNTETVGDLVISCTGGSPTAAGNMVPQVNFTLDLNTNVTSKITASSGGTNFSEALMLVDEPNHLVQPSSVVGLSNPLLNCGQNGAPDKGPSGPGVCSIVSTGIPTQTYDGTPFANGASVCNSGIIGITFVPGNNYGCGRPNAFQGRMLTGLGNNVVGFMGVPFDPPGAGVRIFRITNIRSDAALLKAGTPIMAMVSISNSSTITFQGGSTSSPSVQVGFTVKGMSVSTPQLLTVRVEEGLAESWKFRNVANSVANAVYGGQVCLQSAGSERSSAGGAERARHPLPQRGWISVAEQRGERAAEP